MFQWFFGKQLTPQERLRKNLRSLQRTQQELDREILKLQQQVKVLQTNIKRSIQNNQMNAARIQAKDLVRSNNYVTRFQNVKLQLQAIELRIQTIKSNDSMIKSMVDASRVLNQMNQGVNLPNLNRIIMDFERQNDIMDQKQEIIDETMDDMNYVGEDDTGLLENEDQQANEIIEKIMDEIGVDISTKMNKSMVPNNDIINQNGEAQLKNDVSIATKNKYTMSSQQGETLMSTGQMDNEDELLQQRLNSLKK